VIASAVTVVVGMIFMRETDTKGEIHHDSA
jgi:hypothetical protein